MKPLPNHLEYAFLGEDSTLLVIIAKSLIRIKKGKIIEVLGRHKLVVGWTVADF